MERSTPLTSKTMWTIYVSQASLAWYAHTLAKMAQPSPVPGWVLAFCAGAIAVVGMYGVSGLAFVDHARLVGRDLIAGLKGQPLPAVQPGEIAAEDALAVTPVQRPESP